MTNFERTLSVLQNLLSERLSDEYHRIWVDGCISRSSDVKLVFTIFPRDNSTYSMEFIQVRNFRQFRPDGNLDEEMSIMNRHIDSFQSVLENYIL